MPPETLIDGYTFFVTADSGEPGPKGGLYHRDTRYLSRLAIDVDGATVPSVGRTVHASDRRTRTLATAGPAVNEIHEQNVAKHTDLVVTREQSVHEGAGYAETVSITNHLGTARRVEVGVNFSTDFADLFEVRGVRSDIDRDVQTTVGTRAVTMRYEYETATGAPIERQTTVQFGVPPDSLSSETATFDVTVPSQGTVEVPFSVVIDESREPDDATADQSDESSRPPVDESGIGSVALPERSPPIDVPSLEVGAPYDTVFDRAADDLTALTTESPQGPVALAGTPWFATPFGRDAILTAHQTVAVAPELAAGTLRYFAARQGNQTDDAREEAPGKVFHEIRHGELADRELIPHTPYFGTVDATPLWVTLLAETCRWRGDDSLAVELAPSLVAALEWVMHASADVRDDPFVYYSTERGVLDHKAWKDTADSVRFADGAIAEGPLAVAEVQGYAASALRRGANLLDRIDADRAEEARRELTGDREAERNVELAREASPDRYRQRAETIESAFDREFWLPDREYYALAKDGDGRIVDAVTSNVGHCLWTGTIPESRADAVVETLVDGPLFSGWGVRTMSPRNVSYSPVSYHAGGVWPHDTSLVALGVSQYGYGAAAERLARGVLDAATHFDHGRLPELYCGFGPERDPIEYPAACTPQAWAAGAPFAFLRAVVQPTPTDGGVRLDRQSSLFPTETGDVFEHDDAGG